MVIQDRERADAEQPSAWAPLRERVYRGLFIAQLASNVGTWMQSVAAQWFLVEKRSSDVIVALVQIASLGPALLLGLFARVLADLFDRRRLLFVLQSYACMRPSSSEPGGAVRRGHCYEPGGYRDPGGDVLREPLARCGSLRWCWASSRC
jgi:hypothetical protein